MPPAYLRQPGTHHYNTWGGLHAQCTGKLAYSTPQEAQKVLREQAKRHRADGNDYEKGRAYKCRACGQWHLGGVDMNGVYR
jgi:hypothetical protein